MGGREEVDVIWDAPPKDMHRRVSWALIRSASYGENANAEFRRKRNADQSASRGNNTGPAAAASRAQSPDGIAQLPSTREELNSLHIAYQGTSVTLTNERQKVTVQRAGEAQHHKDLLAKQISDFKRRQAEQASAIKEYSQQIREVTAAEVHLHQIEAKQQELTDFIVAAFQDIDGGIELHLSDVLGSIDIVKRHYKHAFQMDLPLDLKVIGESIKAAIKRVQADEAEAAAAVPMDQRPSPQAPAVAAAPAPAPAAAAAAPAAAAPAAPAAPAAAAAAPGPAGDQEGAEVAAALAATATEAEAEAEEEAELVAATAAVEAGLVEDRQQAN